MWGGEGGEHFCVSVLHGLGRIQGFSESEVAEDFICLLGREAGVSLRPECIQPGDPPPHLYTILLLTAVC